MKGVYYDKSKQLWMAHYKDPLDPSSNKRDISRGFKNKIDAERWRSSEQTLLDAVNRGDMEWTSWQEREAKRQTELARRNTQFETYAYRFVEHFKQGKKTGTGRVYDVALRHVLEMPFTHGRVCDITEDEVQRWYYGDALKNQPDAKERTYQMLKRICKKAVEDVLLEKQPCTLPHVKHSKRGRHNVPLITYEELQIITDNMPDWCRIFPYTAAMLGLRISEVCALQRQDFDLTNRRVHISHGLNRGEGDRGPLHLATPKTESSDAWLFIPLRFMPMLTEWLHTHVKPEPDAMFIESPANGYDIASPNTIRDYFKKAACIAGRPDITPHQLKAAFSTYASRTSDGPATQKAITRHDSLEVEAGYWRQDEEAQRKAVDAAGDLMMPPTDEDYRKRIKALEEERARLVAQLDQF